MGENDTTVTSAIGVEVQVSQNVWLTGSAGTAFGGSDTANGKIDVLSSLKWGYSTKPSW